MKGKFAWSFCFRHEFGRLRRWQQAGSSQGDASVEPGIQNWVSFQLSLDSESEKESWLFISPTWCFLLLPWNFMVSALGCQSRASRCCHHKFGILMIGRITSSPSEELAWMPDRFPASPGSGGETIGSSVAIVGSIHCHQQISRYHQCLSMPDAIRPLSDSWVGVTCQRANCAQGPETGYWCLWSYYTGALFCWVQTYSCHVAEASGDSSNARGCSLRVWKPCGLIAVSPLDGISKQVVRSDEGFKTSSRLKQERLQILPF